jgi:flavin-dependent dehydrogenase
VTKDKRNYDVIIIGGGPAGIATSLTLTARGISNCVVEATLKPQKKSGEAIPPNAKPLLKKLGLYPFVEDPKHRIYYGNKSCWGSDALEQKSFIKDIYGHGFLLNRIYFERQLRSRLEKFGGHFFVGYRLKKVKTNAAGITVQIESSEGEAATLDGKFIVDATGRKASVCQQLGIKKQNLDSQFAFTCAITLPTPVTQEIVVEATSNGWWYAAPQGENELNLMFFTIKALLPPKDKLVAFMQSELKNSHHISKLFDSGNCEFGAIKIMPAGTSRLDLPYGENWLAVGDAAYSFDPISSYGITSALASGMYGGHALASTIEGKTEAFLTYRFLMEKTFQGYLERLIGHYAVEQRWLECEYWSAMNGCI